MIKFRIMSKYVRRTRMEKHIEQKEIGEVRVIYYNDRLGDTQRAKYRRP